jgi:hypothetical protein
MGLALTAALGSPAHRALACSCGFSDLPERLEDTDVVFLGKVASVGETFPTPRPDGLVPIDSDLGTTFTVERVYKGEVAAEAVVQSGSNEASCGIVFEPGQRYIVFASLVDGDDLDPPTDEDIAQLRDPFLMGMMGPASMVGIGTSLCHGNLRYDGPDPERDAVLGEGGPPVPALVATAAVARAATGVAAKGWSVEAIQTRLAEDPGGPMATSGPAVAPTAQVASQEAGGAAGPEAGRRRWALGGVAAAVAAGLGVMLARRRRAGGLADR